MHQIKKTICTESLEAVLKITGDGILPIKYRLELRELAISLYCASNQGACNRYFDPYRAISNFKANLLRQRKTKDQTTSVCNQKVLLDTSTSWFGTALDLPG